MTTLAYYSLGGTVTVIDTSSTTGHEPLERFARSLGLKRKNIHNADHPVLARFSTSKPKLIEQIEKSDVPKISQVEAFMITERKAAGWEMRRKGAST